MSSSSPVRIVWSEMSGQMRGLTAAGLLGFVASFSAVALLGTSAWLIATAAGMPPVLTLSVAAVLVRALALSRAVFRYLERLMGHDAAFRGLTGLRVRVYDQLERLAPTGLAAFGRGDLLSRLVADVDASLDLPLRVVLPWAQAVLVSAATVAFIWWLLPATGAVIAVIALAALVVVPWLSARLAASAEARMAPARGVMAEAVVRALDAAPDIAAFGAQGSAAARVHELDTRLTRLAKRESSALGVGAGLGVIAQGLAVVGALVITVPAVVDGRIGPVWLAVAALLPLALFEILAGLPASALAFEALRGSATRVAELAELPVPVPDPASPVPAPAHFTGLRLESVSASYSAVPGSVAAITDIRLDVAPGERIAIVGPSGAGKSTLANVLMGFLPYSGSLGFSGVEVRDMDGDDMRKHLGLLSQTAHVFDTTIADNVRIGDPSADDQQVSEALADAQLAAYVDALPRGLQTTVGAFGSAMSGGERQRLALARLMIGEHPLVILDEPTEHLDSATADAVMSTILEALRERTLVLITHRLAGLEQFDRIVVLEGGHVAMQGTHGQLLERGGWYADQWHLEAERYDMADFVSGLPAGVAVEGPAAGGPRN